METRWPSELVGTRLVMEEVLEGTEPHVSCFDFCLTSTFSEIVKLLVDVSLWFTVALWHTLYSNLTLHFLCVKV